MYNEYEEVTHGQVNRTWFLDNFAVKVRKKSLQISGYGDHKETYIEHIRDMVRDETPDKPAEWKKLTGNDHFFHASAFMAVGPRIATLMNLKSKADTRIMTGVQVVGTGSSSNLIGVSNKRLVKNPVIG